MLKKPLKVIQKGRNWCNVRQSHLSWPVGVQIAIPQSNGACCIVCTYMSLLNEMNQNDIHVQEAQPRSFCTSVAQLTQLPRLRVPPQTLPIAWTFQFGVHGDSWGPQIIRSSYDFSFNSHLLSDLGFFFFFSKLSPFHPRFKRKW